ncbi:hypothetical protein F4811DRAFT_546394 [Daldinia bambusicola]|nr:hypothetical protein F4811DRAFT_546394 [Daldinia bambusicola]
MSPGFSLFALSSLLLLLISRTSTPQVRGKRKVLLYVKEEWSRTNTPRLIDIEAQEPSERALSHFLPKNESSNPHRLTPPPHSIIDHLSLLCLSLAPPP